MKYISEQAQLDIVAPAGRLGIILQNQTDSRGTIVSEVRNTSFLYEQIFPGDRIIKIDNEDVSQLSVAEITTIMGRKSHLDRTLTVLTTRRKPSSLKDMGQQMQQKPSSNGSMSRREGGDIPPEDFVAASKPYIRSYR
ncbi:MAG: PDZ domain-containing protein [Gaiellaceae bacterium]